MCLETHSCGQSSLALAVSPLSRSKKMWSRLQICSWVEGMRSQRLCARRWFSECRSPPCAVHTGKKKNTSCASFLDPPSWSPTSLWHLPLARAGGNLQPSRRPTQNPHVLQHLRGKVKRRTSERSSAAPRTVLVAVFASNSGEGGECQAIIFSAHQRRHPVWKASLEPTEQLFVNIFPRSCLMPIASRVDSTSVLHSATERFWRRVLVNMLLSFPKQKSISQWPTVSFFFQKHFHGQVLLRLQGIFICQGLLIWHHIAMKVFINTLSGVALACLDSNATLQLGWCACVAGIECFRRLQRVSQGTLSLAHLVPQRNSVHVCNVHWATTLGSTWDSCFGSRPVWPCLWNGWVSEVRFCVHVWPTGQVGQHGDGAAKTPCSVIMSFVVSMTRSLLFIWLACAIQWSSWRWAVVSRRDGRCRKATGLRFPTDQNQDTPVMVGGSSSLKSPWTAVWLCLSLSEEALFLFAAWLAHSLVFSPLRRRVFRCRVVSALPAPRPSCRFWCGRLLDRLGHHWSACVEERIWLSRWGTDVEPSGFRAGVLQLLCVVSPPRVTWNVMMRDLRAEVLKILIAVQKSNGRKTEHVCNMPEVRRSPWTWTQEWAAHDRRRPAVWRRTHDHERIRQFEGQCWQIKTPTFLRKMTDRTGEHLAGSQSCVQDGVRLLDQCGRRGRQRDQRGRPSDLVQSKWGLTWRALGSVSCLGRADPLWWAPRFCLTWCQENNTSKTNLKHGAALHNHEEMDGVKINAPWNGMTLDSDDVRARPGHGSPTTVENNMQDTFDSMSSHNHVRWWWQEAGASNRIEPHQHHERHPAATSVSCHHQVNSTARTNYTNKIQDQDAETARNCWHIVHVWNDQFWD